ncbi:MAG: DNA primase [Chloroflexi bacterium]|nr:DNA primase [Chloroflexota bacterium]
MSTVTDEIKARVDLVELIGRTVALKRVGSAYSGLCPFHSEKTPSFYVRPQTQSYHCYGCGKWGTAFDWLMEREHLEFAEALRILAAQTGVELAERHSAEDDDRARRLYTILERSQTFYRGLFRGAAGARAREYMARRGFDDATLELFGVGYATSGNVLLRYLEKDGFSEQELQAAGVISVTEDEGRPYDFFRERVLFPIRDSQGRTVAFGGRALEDTTTPKYLNSRDTLLFHKQETLFGFDLARRPMAQERQVVVVEGYMDAATAHQHGYRNVVATLGTAVTDRHLRLLRRHVDEIVLALDADAAGQSATWRALQQADESLRVGYKPVVGPTARQQRSAPGRWVKLKILALPNAKDPDELIRADATAWPTLVREATPVIDFVLRRLGSRHDLNTPQGKRAAAEEMLQVLAGIADPIEQDHFVNEVATLLATRPDTIRGLLRRSRQPRSSAPAPAPGPTDLKVDTDDAYLLALLTRLRQAPDLAPEPHEVEFIQTESRAVYHALGGPVPPELQAYARPVVRQLELVERLSAQEFQRELERTRLTIRKRLLIREQEELSALARDSGIDASGRLFDLSCAIHQIDQQLVPERESAGIR